MSQSALFSLDVLTDVWTSAHAEMKNSRGDFQLTLIQPKLVTCNRGRNEQTDNSGTEIATHHVEEYFVAHDAWEVRQLIPTARFRFGAAFKMAFSTIRGSRASQGNFNDTLKSHEAYYPLDHPDVWLTVKNS